MGRKDEDGVIHLCPCCIKCKRSNEFQKVLHLKGAGLVVYRHVQNENTNPKTELEFTFSDGDEEFILHNTKDDKINPADHTLATLDKEKISCPRCKVLYERAEKMLCRVSVLNRHEIMGICDHCLSKQRPCCKCIEIVKKFTTYKYKKQQEESKRVNEWLTKIRQLLANIILKKEDSRKLKNRAYSDVTIDKLWKQSLNDQELGKLFQSETDKPHIARETERSPSKVHRSSEFIGSHLHVTQTFKSYSAENILDLENYEGNNRLKIRNKLPDAEFLEKLGTNTRKRQLFIKQSSINDSFRKEKLFLDLSRNSVSETSVKYGQTLKSSLKKQGKEFKKCKEIFSTPITRCQSESDVYSKTTHTKIGSITEDFIYHFPKEVHSEKKIALDDILSSTELIKETRKNLEARDELIKLKLEEDRKRINAEKQKKVAENRRKFEENRELEVKNKQELQLRREQGPGSEQIEITNELEKDVNEYNIKTKPTKNSMTIGKVIKKLTKLRDETKIGDKLKEEKKEEKEHNEFKVIKEKEITPKTFKKSQEKGKSEIKHLKENIDNHTKIEFGQTKEKEKPLKEKPLKREKQMFKDEIDFTNEKSLKNVHETKKDEKKPVHSPKRDQVSQSKIKKEGKLMQQSQKEKESKLDFDKNDAYLEKEESQKKKPHHENNRLKENLERKTLQKPQDPKMIEKEGNLDELRNSKFVIQKQLEKEEKIVGKQSQRAGKLKQLGEIPQPKIKKEKEETVKEKPNEAEQRKKKDEDYDMAELKKNLAQEAKQKEEELKLQKQMEQQKKQIQEESDKKAKEEAQIALKKMREAKPEPVTATEAQKVEKPVEKSKIKELNIQQIKVYNPSEDDLILRLVTIRQSQKREVKTKPKTLSEISKVVINSHKAHKHKKLATCIICRDSDLELDAEFNASKESEEKDIIKGQKIYKYKPSIFEPKEDNELVPILFKSEFKEEDVKNILMKEKHAAVCDEVVVHDIPSKTRKPAMADQDTKGIVHYALSDRAFIEKGWTMLPTEKVVRKMNVYRMRPAHPEFDWFTHNKNRREMQYDSGEKLAEIDDNGRGRWFYRNGRLALDYYDAEEINAQQRFVVYSSGEPDERGRTHPITILATFDYLGNGIVFDHAGKIRLKYNQTEGVILDRGIGPVSHWKWHTLNDPPVLQQVMIDTQVAIKDPQILQLGNPTEDKTRPDNEEMLAIEFDNFIKEKSKKLSQKFKPFQIKMKALKINEHFSLRVLDQATIYLIFRDGPTNLKLNMGMILDHKEIVDTDTAEVGEVSNNVERLPARTASLAGLQRSVAHAQRAERARLQRERRLRPPAPAPAPAAARLASPRAPWPAEGSVTDGLCLCRRTSSNLYYDTRLI